jgi:NTE family protein
MVELYRRPTIGLALGGGGMRGLAHIGVLKVLEKEEIPIDCLVGSSMGGLLAALYAGGISAADLEVEVNKVTRTSRLLRLLDWSPGHGLLKGERLRRYICAIIGENRRFADLRIPLALTAVDLCTGSEVLLDRGELVGAILATIAVPGVFPPVELKRQHLVDGGVLNNVPADVARHLGAEKVIAVNVNFSPGEEGYQASGEDPRPWVSNLMPGFAQDFYRAELIMVEAMTKVHLRKAHPELILRPEIPPGVTIFSGFSQVEEIIRAGEQAALEAIEKIRDLLKPGLRLPPRLNLS